MRLVVGLGNPGAGYAGNRHNIGFMAVDTLVRRHGFGPWRAKFQGRLADGVIAGGKVLALEPETYMNLSGQSVAAAMRFHKIAPEDVIVLHDELDLPPGRVRVKKGGGAGGHNGLKSIDAHIGREYWRVRLGIGHPGNKDLVSGYVLHDFAKADDAWLGPLLDAVADAFPFLLDGQDNGFMNRVATLTQATTPKPKPKPESDRTEP
ncbi:MAG: aminoacyl-tRNA hydrolase [Alphaproteobacteria bacterium]|nr:aminoacyl-tRNA hydrolase [Alphaproteobacteria bacterium]